MTRKQQVIVLIGLAISAVFLALAFRNLDFQAAWESLRAANVPIILFASVWFFAGRALIALRWQYLLRGIRRVPLAELYRLTCIGYMGNNVYPLRAGEVLRIYLLQRNGRIPFAQGTVITLAERTFDGLVMVSFIVVSLALLNIGSPEIQSMVTVGTLVFGAALVAFLLLAAKPAWFRAVAGAVARPLPARLREIALHLTEQILASLQGMRSPALLLGAVVSSYLSWLAEASVYWLVGIAMGVDVGFTGMVLVVGVVNLAGLIPASPGQLGVFEFFTTLVLTSLGVGYDLALTYALVVHVVIWLPVTAAGFILLVRQGLGWSSITQAHKLEEIEEKAAST